MQDLANRLRTLRRQRHLTLEQLSQRSNLTKSYLSKLERGVSEPSISTVLKLARAYDIDLSELIGTDQEVAADVSIVRAHQRMPLDALSHDKGRHYEAVVGRRTTRAMNPFIVRPPHAERDVVDLFPHAGEEFMFVLNGRVIVHIGTQTCELEAGDSIYFNSELPHRLLSTSAERAEILVVVSQA